MNGTTSLVRSKKKLSSMSIGEFGRIGNKRRLAGDDTQFPSRLTGKDGRGIPSLLSHTVQSETAEMNCCALLHKLTYVET